MKTGLVQQLIAKKQAKKSTPLANLTNRAGPKPSQPKSNLMGQIEAFKLKGKLRDAGKGTPVAIKRAASRKSAVRKAGGPDQSAALVDALRKRFAGANWPQTPPESPGYRWAATP